MVPAVTPGQRRGRGRPKGGPVSFEVHKARIERRLGVWFPFLGKTEDADIAAAIGVSQERVRQYRAVLGIPRFARAENPIAAQVLQAWNAGKSMGKIARELGVHTSAVANCLAMSRRRGEVVRDSTISPSVDPLPAGAPRKRWTDERLREVQGWWAEGVPKVEIARRAGLTLGSMSPWLSRYRKRGWAFPDRRPVSWVGAAGENPKDKCLVEMWEQGERVRDILAALGCTTVTMYRRLALLRVAGWDLPPRRGAKGPDMVTMWQCDCGYRARAGHKGDLPTPCPGCARERGRWRWVGVVPRPRSISKPLVGEQYRLEG